MLTVSDLHMPNLRRATAADSFAIKRLLVDAGLPVADLDADKLENFLVAQDEADLLGLIGIELFGTVGLLRSLVVTGAARRLGLGGKLVGALESAAETAGVTELWLLTIDAQGFFERQGYRLVERTGVPDSISLSDEFGELCPATAYLMMKALT